MRFLTGPMTQLAWVVADIGASEEEFARSHGVPHWTRMNDVRFGPEEGCRLRGAPADFSAHVSLAYVGDLQLELIQPLHGDSIYAEFLAARGSGPHHGCWETDDLDATLARLGRDVVQEGSMAGGELRFAYVEPGLPGLPFVEIVEVGPGMRAFFDAVKQDALR